MLQVAAETAQFRWTSGAHIGSPVVQLATAAFTNQSQEVLRQLTRTHQFRAPLIQLLQEHLLAAGGRQSPPVAETSSGLPVDLSSLVGRQREISEIQLLLKSGRLLTLTGTAGIGKTRLALEVARRVQHQYADGVAFVDLAPLSDPGLVAQAAALAARDHSGRLGRCSAIGR